MDYSQSHIIRSKTGNNAFSYGERKKLLWKAELTIPSLIKGVMSDIKIGNSIAFEEIDHRGTLRQCKGLQNLIKLEDSSTKITAPTYIIDNHNHALYFRVKEIQSNKIKYDNALEIIHIDQHSDLANPIQKIDDDKPISLDEIRHYSNHKCNVGNFIRPFLHLFPQAQFQRIKSESQLWEYKIKQAPPTQTTILDIDLDFRSPEMNIKHNRETIQKTKDLMSQASLITIATSPYFLNQNDAIALLHKLLAKPTKP